MKNLLFLLLVLCYGCKSSDNSSPTTPVTTVDTVGKFRNPLLSAAPDPWVTYKDGFYYVMHTTGNSLRIYKTRTMSRLGMIQPTTVWTPPATGLNSRDIWAPELYFLNGKWYIYYAADNNGVDATHRMFVLENASADPTQGTWIDKGQLNLPENRWAIDGTILQLNGKLYVAWSGWETDLGGSQHLYICRLTNPYTVEGTTRVRLSSPEYAWEKQGFGVNEGPEFLARNNKVFLTYSASFCGTDLYALGQLSADSSANLLDIKSWTKSATPVFGPNAGNSTYGLGHNSFFITSDGKENWLVYHANAAPGQGCGDQRSMRMQPFTWKADGSPDFGSPIPLTEWIKRPSGE